MLSLSVYNPVEVLARLRLRPTGRLKSRDLVARDADQVYPVLCATDALLECGSRHHIARKPD